MVRICLVTTEHPLFGVHGGIGTFVHGLAQGLGHKGYQVTVLARVAGWRHRAHTDGVIQVVPVPVFGDRLGSRLGCAIPALNFAWAVTRMVRRIEAEQGPFDLIETPDYWAPGVLLPSVSQTPVVVRLHGHSRLIRQLNERAPAKGQRILESLERRALHQARAVLSQSQALLTRARDDYGLPRVPVRVVLPGLDPKRVPMDACQALRARWQIPDEAIVFLFVGRLEHRKGVAELFEAWLRLVGRGHDAYLVLVGQATPDFPDADAFPTRARQAGKAHLLRMTGFVPHDQIHHWYATSDVFVAPSRHEPLGLVYLEAMAAGCAILATATGGVPEIATHQQEAYLVRQVDPDQLQHAMHVLFDSAPLRERLGYQAKQRMYREFSVNAMVCRTADAYQQLLGVKGTERMALIA